MELKTRISKLEQKGVTLRGEKLSSLVEKGKFTDTVFLQLSGRKPSTKESILFEKILISVIDHGMGNTSSMTSRFIASGGNSLNVGVGGGILSIGNHHGGAAEKAMHQFNDWNKNKEQAKEMIRSKIMNKEIIFGFGHKFYQERDPRVSVLLEEMKKIGFESKYLYLKDMVENSFEELKGKKIFLNVDGLIAIILCDFGFDPLLGKGIFIIGRTSGLVAQCSEELKHEKPVRRFDEDKVTYLENE